MARRVRKFLGMTPLERRAALQHRKDYMVGTIFLGWLGTRLNRSNRFVYLSYVPDSIREYAAFPDFGQLVDSWTHNNGRRNAGDLPRLLFLIQNSQRILGEGVLGDFAELGVHKGNSAKVLVDILGRVDPERRLYLFDTFGGFDARDLGGVDADVPALYSDTSLGAVRVFVGNEGLCDYRPGYFPESANTVDPEVVFALVHLDCDLYEPTRSGLDFFYPRLSPGAFVVLHDYSSGHWPGVSQAVDEFLADKPEQLVLLPDKSGTAVFRKEK
jgi:hypothetical protein